MYHSATFIFLFILFNCIGNNLLSDCTDCTGVTNNNNIDWENICLTSNNSTVQSFLDTVQDLFMFQHILKPTRYRGEETPNLLDLVFTDDENMIENLTYLPGLGNSDH